MAYTRFLNSIIWWFDNLIWYFNNLSRAGKGFFIVVTLLVYLFCRTPTTFRVLDAETGKPIEGAVAIAMWDATKGLPGLTYSYTDIAIEAVSDKEGKLRFPFLFGKAAFFRPQVKVYKARYVGWDSKLIYLGHHRTDKMRPHYKRRKDFSMRNQKIFLEPWKDEYTYISHYKLINTPPDIYAAGLKKSKYEDAIDYESSFRGKERKRLSQ